MVNRKQAKPQSKKFSPIRDKVLEIDGITYRLHLFAPTQGERGLTARLTSLMEKAAQT